MLAVGDYICNQKRKCYMRVQHPCGRFPLTLLLGVLSLSSVACVPPGDDKQTEKPKENGSEQVNEQARLELAKGIAFSDKSDWDTAISCFSEAIRLDANYADAFYNRGFAYDKQGLHEQAVKDYTQAIQLNPENAAPYYKRAVIFKDSGMHDEAIQDFTEVIRLFPKETSAVKLQPNHALAYSYRGESYARTGWLDEAI
jgi:tetratricopeptide (TPR) repeat protein